MTALALLVSALLVSLGAGCSCGESHTPVDAAPAVDAFATTDAADPSTDAPGLDAPGLDAFATDSPAPMDDVAARVDAPGTCITHALRPMHIESITSLEALDVHAGRSFRVRAAYTQSDTCHSRAMTDVEIDPATHTVSLVVRDWVEEGLGCGELARPDARTITLQLESGDWTIRDASEGGTASLAITIGPGIRAACVPDGGDCLQNCDCLGDEVCLSATGLGGPYTACAEPCEEDLDCSEGGSCTSFDDGFDLVCSAGGGCGATGACPDGYACEGGSCTPTFRLAASTRVECTCDSECEEGLSCVTGATGSRCEARCPTAGAWCSSMHFCGEERQDVAGLAVTDAVCVWAGE